MTQQFQAPTAQYGYPQQARPTNGMATASLILGIVAIVAAIVLLNPFTYLVGNVIVFPTMLLAIVFGHSSRGRFRATGVGGGASLTGMILGYVTLGVFALANVAYLFFAVLLS